MGDALIQQHRSSIVRCLPGASSSFRGRKDSNKVLEDSNKVLKDINKVLENSNKVLGDRITIRRSAITSIVLYGTIFGST